MAICEMMAIGDSLFNGVRSLTIDKTLAQWSVPAQLAKALGISDFAIPDYPRNVVINFEQWVRDLPFVSKVFDDLNGNISFWNTQPKSALPQFDNIAIASSLWSDLYDRTWKTAQAEIDAINTLVAQGKTTYNDNLAELFFAFNTRFILNPTGDPNTPALSPLEIVAARKPKRLIISIGANNGLWAMAFAATACTGAGQATGPFSAGDLAQLQTFITKLQALPPDIEHIYINTLPHPSDTATMMPVDDGELDDKPGAGKFYPRYENRFGFNYNQLSGDQVAANDKVIDDLKAHIAGLVTDPRIHFVPIDTTFDAYDFKTNAQAKVVAAPNDDRPLSNIMINKGTDAQTDDEYWYGGLIGMDGMHPTFIGYNVMAQTVLATIQANEPGLAIPNPLPTVAQVYNADKLVNDLPGDWGLLLGAWLEIRRLSGVGQTPAASPTNSSVKSLMSVVKFKTT